MERLETERPSHSHCEAVIASLERERDAICAALRQALALLTPLAADNVALARDVALINHWTR